MNVVIIGGGASGMMCASQIKNHDVTILEKNEKLGKKLYITGKGRCNVTNDSDEENIISNTISNPYFLYSSVYGFNAQSAMKFFEDNGIKLKVERGNRVFPVTDKSSDIIKAFKKSINHADVNFNAEVKDILISDDKVVGVMVKNKIIKADCVVVATGGLSYKTTGSTGDGYRFAKDANHNVTNLYPSLVPLVTNNKEIFDLQGLSLRNIQIDVKVNNKSIYSDFGEVMFTHYGISGPLILKASRHLVDKLDEKVMLSIDLKPALSDKELDRRVLKDFEENKNKTFKNSLNKLLPQKIIPLVIKYSKINEDKKVNEITKEERQNLIKVIKGFEIEINGTTGYKDAVVTCGGVDVKDIDPSTMESKNIKNLYFVGEVLDVDAFTGGYNLQIAYSTGYAAGTAINNLE